MILSFLLSFIGIASANQAPVANAGENFLWAIGSELTLDASNSYDPDGDVLSFKWSISFFPEDSELDESDLGATEQSTLRFTPVDVGDHQFLLTVSDGTHSDTDLITVVVKDNAPPQADAGDDQEVEVGTRVLLDGRYSGDIDGDALLYEWSLKTLPTASELQDSDLADPRSVLAAFTPDVPGDYVVELAADDGFFVETSTVTVTALPASSCSHFPRTPRGLLFSLLAVVGIVLQRSRRL